MYMYVCMYIHVCICIYKCTSSKTLTLAIINSQRCGLSLSFHLVFPLSIEFTRVQISAVWVLSHFCYFLCPLYCRIKYRKMSPWTAYLSKHTGFSLLWKNSHTCGRVLEQFCFHFPLSGIEDVFEGVRNLGGRKDFVGRALQLSPDAVHYSAIQPQLLKIFNNQTSGICKPE